MKLKLTILAAAMSLASSAFAGETQQTFNAADMQQLFGQKSKPAQLATLSQKEMKETEGAATDTGWRVDKSRKIYVGGVEYYVSWEVRDEGGGYTYDTGNTKLVRVVPLVPGCGGCKENTPQTTTTTQKTQQPVQSNQSYYVTPGSIKVQSMNTWNGQGTGGQLGIAGQFGTIR
ncbi:MAG: hypothetical protein FWH56_05970 [Betaproteobacteria bacterium]|nr:hypothetical protein [Betaproteobacteria bacterium]